MANAAGFRNEHESIKRYVHPEDKTFIRAKLKECNQSHNMIFLNKRGVVSLLTASKKPEAGAFREYLCSVMEHAGHEKTSKPKDAPENKNGVSAQAANTDARVSGESAARKSEDLQRVTKTTPDIAGVPDLLRILCAIAKDNGRSPSTIAETAMVICNQFGLSLPDDFVRYKRK